MKRFTETRKWEDSWFRKLPTQYKLLWMFILDRCDNAGIWDEDLELAAYFTGFDFDREETLKTFEDRVLLLSNKWFIPKFIDFQYKQLTWDSYPHRPVIEELLRYGLVKESLENKGIFRVLLWVQEKEKEKDKEKDKDYSKFLSDSKLPLDIQRQRELSRKQAEQRNKEFTLESCVEIWKSLNQKREIAETYFDHYNSSGWCKGNGAKITNLQSHIATIYRDKDKMKWLKNLAEGRSNSEPESKTIIFNPGY